MSSTRTIQGHKESKLLELAVKEVQNKSTTHTLFDMEQEARMPKLNMTELTLGKVLGTGGFCEVFEITKIALDKRIGGGSSSGGSTEFDERQIHNLVQDRTFMEKHCQRGNGKKKDARYAVKILHKSCRTKDASHFVNGVVDLAMEARFLTIVRHPNIIKMRAFQSMFQENQNHYTSYCTEKFFIVLDRLYDTLTDRLAIWKKAEPCKSKLKKLADMSGKKSKNAWIERLNIAYELATAIKYLHDLKIMYRDLKPDNIGFDVRGDVKIFDFGLAKEFNPRDADSNGLYAFTADTGSPRYMSPENAMGQPYNEKSDVYAFAVLCWEIMELETPYVGYTNMKVFKQKVIQGGSRPRFTHPNWTKLSPTVMDMIQKGWGNLSTRPSIDNVCDLLRDMINVISEEGILQDFDVSNKSIRNLNKADNNFKSVSALDGEADV